MVTNLVATETMDPVAMEMCDHSDGEKEHDKKESGESDDLISHDARIYSLILQLPFDKQ